MPGPAHAARPVKTSSFEEVVTSLIVAYETRLEELGRRLHDDLGQVLSGVGLQLEALRLDFAQHPELSERVGALQSVLEQAMASTRRLSGELNPSIVERAGLRYAVQQLVDRYRFGFSVDVGIDPAVRLSRPAASGFYRVAEFALARAARSKSCSNLVVHLRAGEDGNQFEVRFDSDPRPADQHESPHDRLEFLKIQHHMRLSQIRLAIKTRGRSTIITSSDSDGTRSIDIDRSRSTPKGS